MIGSKPKRNRERRRFQAAVREMEPQIDLRLDWIFSISKNAVETPTSDIRTELRELVKQTNNRWADELESS